MFLFMATTSVCGDWRWEAFSRARPNPETRFTLEAYGIKDKLNQGGIQLTC